MGTVWPRMAAWWLVAAAAAAVGVTTTTSDNIALIAPGVGVLFGWLLHEQVAGTRTTRVLAVVLVVLTTVAASLVVDDSAGVAVGAVLNLLPAVLAHQLCRRWRASLWGCGGRRPLEDVTDLAVVVAAIAVGVVLGDVVRGGWGALALGNETWAVFWMRLGRMLAALVGLGLLILTVMGQREAARDAAADDDEALGWPQVPSGRAGALLAAELAALVAVTWVAFEVGFVLYPELPVTFVLTLLAVWAALRFTPASAVAVSLTVGVVAQVLTLSGVGPVAAIESLMVRTLVEHLFIVVVVLIGLVVALSRRQAQQMISRLQRSERSVSTRAQELDVLISSLDEGVAIIEEGGDFVVSNDALWRILNGQGEVALDTERMRPAQEYELYHLDGRPLLDSELPYLRALRGEDVVGQELQLRRGSMPGGRMVEVNARRIPGPEGAPPRALVTLRDISAEVAHRQALASFASTVAHDLNNPLNVIGGWAEALEEEFADSDSVPSSVGGSMVAHIRSGAEQMAEFVRDLLNQALARDQTLQPESVSLAVLVKELRDARIAPGSSAEILGGELGEIWADRAMVRQLLDNLIGNAMKYVAPGVAPRVVVDSVADQPGWTRVRVRDNGIGIPPEDRDRVFESFARLREAEYQGSGLGLAICRQVVERHGGAIRVVGGEPDGSCFEMLLPTTSDSFAAARAGVRKTFEDAPRS